MTQSRNEGIIYGGQFKSEETIDPDASDQEEVLEGEDMSEMPTDEMEEWFEKEMKQISDEVK